MKTKFKQSRAHDLSLVLPDTKLAHFFNDFFDLTTLTLIILFLLFNSLSSFGQNSCQIDLNAYKGRNIRSVPLNGTYYTMIITNKSSSRSVYSLSAQNINSTCRNTDGSGAENNVNVTSAFLDADRNPINQIVVGAEQSVKFLVRITVPSGTGINKWCCTQISATSNECSNYRVSTVLHTLVINPSEE